MGKRVVLRIIISSIFVLAFLCLHGELSGTEKDGKGKPFTDPSRIFPMPQEWIKKPISYEEWAKDADISAALDQDIYHTLLPLIQKYGREHNLKIAVKEGTCGIAAGMLSRKAIDIGGFCCPPGAEDRLPGIKFHTLGIVAKAILVHPENPVDSLSEEKVREIFRGKVYRWSELKDKSGRPGPEWTITPVGRFHCQTRPGHWRLILDSDKLFGPKVHEVGSIPDMIAEIASKKGAIGWEVLSMPERYSDLGKTKPLKINGFAPTDIEALATKKYPFYRVYNLTTWEGKGIENPKAKKLVEYLIKEVEKLGPKFGFAPTPKLRKAGWKFRDEELIAEPH